MAESGNALPFQPGLQVFSGKAKGVHLHRGLRHAVVRNEHRLQSALGKVLLEQRNQGIRMAVLIRVRSRLFQLTPVTDGVSQNAVNQGSRLGIFAVFFSQGNGFIHRRAVRDFVQFIELIEPQVENVPHHRVQILQSAREQLLQVKIQLLPVLGDSVAQPAGQCRVPAVQPVPADGRFQHGVGPSILPAAGDQRIQRGFPGAHQASRGWPRK